MTHFVFEDLGVKDYKECWTYQESIHQQVVDDKMTSKKSSSLNRFLLVEHPHVYTLGKSGDGHNLLVDSAFLEKIGAVYYKTNRGGDITYHGPGQLVGYPVVDLDYYQLGAKAYVAKMEEAIIRVIGNYGLKGSLKEGATGVWLDPENQAKARKICAIGVRVSRSVTMHGFALNVNTDLRYFGYINPCGFISTGVTSLERELGYKIDMQEVKEAVKMAFNEAY